KPRPGPGGDGAAGRQRGLALAVAGLAHARQLGAQVDGGGGVGLAEPAVRRDPPQPALRAAAAAALASSVCGRPRWARLLGGRFPAEPRHAGPLQFKTARLWTLLLPVYL